MELFYEQRNMRICALRGELEWETHLHNEIEIVCMRQGICDAYIDGAKYELTEGDCLIVFPNRIHDFRNGREDMADVLLVSPAAMTEYSGILSKKLPVSPYVPKVSSEIRSLFENAYECSGRFADSIRWGYCTAIIGRIFESMEFRDVGSSDGKTLQQILDYCAEHYNEAISVTEVAKALNLSESYVSHIFSDKLLISFRGYINSMRVHEAMKLIDEGKLSNTEIAYETGFGTIRTFNRAFSAHTGCTPSEYKKRK